MNLLRFFVRAVVREAAKKREDDKGDLLLEPDLIEDRDQDPTDEYSGAANIAGYTLPLGASNHPTTLQQRGDIAGQGFGGAKPIDEDEDEDE